MALLGQGYPRQVLIELQRRGIHVNSAASVVFQPKQSRWVISGLECGGASGTVGLYVGYIGATQAGIDLLIPVHTLVPNDTHSRIYGTDLVRFEMFRFEQGVSLTVTRLYFNHKGDGRRPDLLDEVLLQLRDGQLADDAALPTFYDGSGEQVELPKELVQGITLLSKAVRSQNLKIPMFRSVPSLELNPPILSAEGATPEPVSARDPAKKPSAPVKPVASQHNSRKTVSVSE